jgi:hypothetical protein
MSYYVVETLELASASQQTHVLESRLWKLSSTALSPVKRRFETGLFLIAGSLGIGATVYGMHQLIAFFHSDSLTQTITALLH